MVIVAILTIAIVHIDVVVALSRRTFASTEGGRANGDWEAGAGGAIVAFLLAAFEINLFPLRS